MKKREAHLGQRVLVKGSLLRETVEEDLSKYSDVQREWVRYPREPIQGVLVGIRHLQNGRIVTETESDGYFSTVTHKTWRCEKVVPAFLVSTDLLQTPVLVAIEDVEAVEG